MVVFILERVPTSAKGELSRWMVQPKSGVFVGHVSARVRDLIWDRIVRGLKRGAAVLVFTSNEEPGYTIRTFGDTQRVMQDYDGLALPKTRISS